MLRSEHMVACRDGVRLATDVYLPEGEGPWPVILERTPYGKREVSRSERTAADPKPQKREVIAEYFTGTGWMPASTVVGINALSAPGARLEIDVVAARSAEGN